MKYLCTVEVLNKEKFHKKGYLFTYDFAEPPKEHMIVHCETRYGGMFGKITEWAKLPTGKTDQEMLIT